MTEASANLETPPESSDEATMRTRLADLQAELDKERDQATDYMKRWQYAQAEVANIRRRSQQEREELTKYGVAPLAASLLEVLDNFERAEQVIPAALQSLTWISGVVLIHRQLEYVLQQHGLERIETAGQVYDAGIHEALTQEHHASIAEGAIIAEVQRGYKLQGRLMRPALVRVSQGPVAEESPPNATAGDAEDTDENVAGATPETEA
ncbi:MAG: nucleotide exchange factor GrpE [Chloroflexota bacterium]